MLKVNSHVDQLSKTSYAPWDVVGHAWLRVLFYLSIFLLLYFILYNGVYIMKQPIKTFFLFKLLSITNPYF